MKRSGFAPRKTPMSRGTSTLKQKSPMARGTSTLTRSTKPMKAVGERGKRMRQGKVAPNVEEAEWMDAIVGIGCIVCRLHHASQVPAEVHHLKDGDRRIGHLSSIGLCYGHHRGGLSEGLFISRHPWKTRFEDAYGSEQYLLEETKKLLQK